LVRCVPHKVSKLRKLADGERIVIKIPMRQDDKSRCRYHFLLRKYAGKCLVVEKKRLSYIKIPKDW